MKDAILRFVCPWCTAEATAGRKKHKDCGNHCDCQHGTPKVKHSVRH